MSVTKQTEQLQILAERLRPLYDALASHPLYRAFRTVEDLHVFMEAHVFAVWDFMSLLKTLQQGLTCVEVPWVPSRFAASRRLVNEIVLGEESDVYRTEAVSHFELYLRAMRECGASTVAIDALLAALREGMEWRQALMLSSAPEAAKRFVQATFAVIEDGKLHSTAAAFTFGREDLIPDMFRGFVRDQNEQLHGRLELMRWYMERHIEVDSEEHGPMALQMVAELCGDDAVKWEEAAKAAEMALHARIDLWNGITESLMAGRRAAFVSE
jgi:hypothetical protein